MREKNLFLHFCPVLVEDSLPLWTIYLDMENILSPSFSKYIRDISRPWKSYKVGREFILSWFSWSVLVLVSWKSFKETFAENHYKRSSDITLIDLALLLSQNKVSLKNLDYHWKLKFKFCHNFCYMTLNS